MRTCEGTDRVPEQVYYNQNINSCQ